MPSTTVIAKHQTVLDNPEYCTSQEGEFDLSEFVLCQHKTESTPNTCAFLASSVVGINPEENQ